MISLNAIQFFWKNKSKNIIASVYKVLFRNFRIFTELQLHNCVIRFFMDGGIGFSLKITLNNYTVPLISLIFTDRKVRYCFVRWASLGAGSELSYVLRYEDSENNTKKIHLNVKFCTRVVSMKIFSDCELKDSQVIGICLKRR